MKKVLVGMSGGVDSSVTAFLLKEEGYEVIGATMTLFSTDEEENKGVSDAKKVCEKLNIKHYTISLKKEFKEHVINNFIETYKNGMTPNPCIECNKYLKFGALWEKAQELGCDYIATGHYAKIEDNKLLRINSPKDQSYFLYKINKEVLPHILFPLNKFEDKEEVRKIAKTIGLEVATKKDSQDICFIKDNDYAKFLEENLKILPDKGNFVLKTGEIIGQHKGLFYYTIGQRKGLGISYFKPLYVIDIDKLNNTIILGDEEDLYNKTIYITNINLLVDNIPQKASGKIRYKYQPTSCTINKIDNNNYEIIFDEPVKSATKGQSLVLYDNDICLGGGIIIDKK